MSATALQRGKKSGVNSNNGHVPAGLTGTTTPAGIAANDPEAIPEWSELRPKLREILHLPKDRVFGPDHLRVCQLVELEDGKLIDRVEAADLVEKYFPAESADPAPLREDPPAEKNGKRTKRAEQPPQESQTLSRITLAYCVRHPDNRLPKPEDVEALARSIDEQGLRHPPTVRALPPGHGHIPKGWKHPSCWQILSGETRALALRSLGRKECDARVRPCSDEEALDYLARDNAERTDLDPIEKARLMKRLCQSPADGGGGKTTAQVAALYKLKDGSSVSNLMRLLELPQVWQERVASGALPQSFARLLVPYAHAPKLMDAFDAAWKKAYGPKGEDWQRGQWENRQELEEEIWRIVHENTRPIDGTTTHHHDYDQVGTFGVYEPRLFELTDDLREQLGVVTLEIREHIGGGKAQKREVATHAKLWDKLNVPLVKQKLAKKTKGQAAKAGREDTPAKKELTPAEKKRREKEKAEQLERRIDDWRDKWLASLLLEVLDSDELVPEMNAWLTICLASEDIHLPRRYPNSGGAEIDAAAEIGKALGRSDKRRDRDVFRWLADLSHDLQHALEAGERALARCVLLACAAEDSFRPLWTDQLEALAAYCKIDLAEEWKELQAAVGVDGASDADIRADAVRYESFFELHQNAQLDALGQELGVHVEHVAGKAQKIKLLLGCERQLKLPKAIKPLPAAKAKGSGKGKRGK